MFVVGVIGDVFVVGVDVIYDVFVGLVVVLLCFLVVNIILVVTLSIDGLVADIADVDDASCCFPLSSP